MTEEQLVKKLNNFNIGVNVRELDTMDQAIVTQLFSMISGENIGEPFISCDFRISSKRSAVEKPDQGNPLTMI